jgi:hypothetical protein
MDDNSKGSIVGNINPFSQIFGSSAGQRPEARTSFTEAKAVKTCHV